MLDGVGAAFTSSLHHDLVQGKRLELEALHGHAVRLGERHGIPTPMLFAVYAALKPYADGPPQAVKVSPRYTGRVSPARRLLGYFGPYAARYGAGVVCLAFGTAFSLGIPWQVKEAVDGLRGGGGALRSSFQAVPQRNDGIGAWCPARHSES